MLKPMTPEAKNLMKAREMIADESKWCVGAWECDGKHCAQGALQKVLTGMAGPGIAAHTPEMELLEKAARSDNVPCGRSIWEHGVCALNNIEGHAAVMKMYDRAIEMAA